MKHNLLEELIKFKFEKFNGIGHQSFRGCGNTWRQGHISRRVCTQEGTYQNRCGTAYVIKNPGYHAHILWKIPLKYALIKDI